MPGLSSRTHLTWDQVVASSRFTRERSNSMATPEWLKLIRFDYATDRGEGVGSTHEKAPHEAGPGPYRGPAAKLPARCSGLHLRDAMRAPASLSGTDPARPSASPTARLPVLARPLVVHRALVLAGAFLPRLSVWLPLLGYLPALRLMTAGRESGIDVSVVFALATPPPEHSSTNRRIACAYCSPSSKRTGLDTGFGLLAQVHSRRVSWGFTFGRSQVWLSRNPLLPRVQFTPPLR